jgi:hypothetical protein
LISQAAQKPVITMRDDDFSLADDMAEDSTHDELSSIADLGAEHWQEEIEFLEQRLRGDQGEIDKDDRETCQVALEIARDNLQNCLRGQKD